MLWPTRPRTGKRVTAFVELMARFDEERNVKAVDVLRQAGVHIIHGVKDLKVHCKLVLVERMEGRQKNGYTYIGTGNFNEDTARLYSDVGLLTAAPALPRTHAASSACWTLRTNPWNVPTWWWPPTTCAHFSAGW